ncbi:MAG: contractile injection system tape measure protein [Bacteroidota bacterium]
MQRPIRHIIRRQVLEVQGVKEADAQALQQEMQEVFHQHIVPLLDQYLTEMSPKGERVQMERLELDLGVLNRDHLLEDMCVQLESALQEHASSQPQDSIRQAPLKAGDQHMELLRVFLNTGILPWWAEEDAANPVKESLEYLLASGTEALHAAMKAWAGQSNASLRLLNHIEFSFLLKLLASFRKVELRQFSLEFSYLMRVLGEIHPWNDFSPHQFHKHLALVLLPWGYQYSRYGEAAQFWQGLLIQMASAEGIPFVPLLKQMDSRTKIIPPQGDVVLPTIIQQMVAQHLPQNSADAFEKIEQQLIHLQNESLLSADLLLQLEQMLLEIRTHPQDLTLLSQARSLIQHIEARLTQHQQLLDQLTDLSGSDLNEQVLDTLAHMRKGLLSTEDQRRLERMLEEMAMQSSRENKSKENNAFSEGNELYVTNAGLVILWPFLIRFFDNVGLMKEGSFVDQAAAHRAVGLLQYLADGQTEQKEYLCGLNKILCGLAWDEVWDMRGPLTNTELEECEQLLKAVIANSAIPGEMSMDGFRGTFLLRKGILRSLPGIWQLHVEQETYDIVLKKVPWSWSMVKLPWMEWGMEVVWS